jgi:sulfotransferase
MSQKIFYQSSLPRSGSTLLQNILAQNPDIYATPTSGMMELIYGARANYTNSPEFISQDVELMKKGFLAFCKAGMEAWASAVTDKKYYIDKGRSWGAHYDWLKMIKGENPKIIIMVRDLRDVFASMEKNHRKNPDKTSALINWEYLQNTSVPKRIDTWANGIPVGLAVERIKEIIDFKNDVHMHFVRYEELCLNPDDVMRKIYNYLEIPFYNHNFDHIEQTTKEDDSLNGGFGDHIIRHRLSLNQSDALEILGESPCNYIYKRYEWFFQYFKYNF